MTATWDPAQYGRFAAERRQPFDDLLALVEPCPGGRVLDLGCGTGELTAELHRHTGAAETLGVDTSVEMLARAEAHASPEAGLHFGPGDADTWNPASYNQGRFDVVFANASLQWVDDHPALLRRLRQVVAPGGQLAFQVPNQGSHASHRLAAALVREPLYLEAFGGVAPRGSDDPVLRPEAYASLLDQLGACEQHVRLQIYGHHLPSAGAVVEWVKGSLLTPIQAGLDEDRWAQFLAEYRRRLVAELGDAAPCFYPYRRILVRARFP